MVSPGDHESTSVLMSGGSDLHRTRDRRRAAVQAMEDARLTLGDCDVCGRGIAVGQDERAHGRSDGEPLSAIVVLR